MNGTELRSFGHLQILTKNLINGPEQKSLKSTNFEVCLIHCRTVNVSQNDQIQ